MTRTAQIMMYLSITRIVHLLKNIQSVRIINSSGHICINHCEEAMNSLQEELYQLKSKDKNNSRSSRLKGVDADKSESASTIKDKSTDHGKKKRKKDLPKTETTMSPLC